MKARLALIVAALAVAGSCAVEIPGLGSGDAGDVEIPQSDVSPPPSDLADVVEAVLPSVVNVRVKALVCGALGVVEGRGEGSGVVIDRRGVILTNAHVVANAVEVEVVFNDDHGSMTGHVVGSVPERDIAVVRVDAGDLDPIDIGKSSHLRLGDDVVAIGFPLGLGGASVTKGILSAVDRTITTAGGSGAPARLEGLLQTDAAINPGNSGGALVDAAGRLVGINTAAAQAGEAENIGFAIAIDGALPVVEEILNEPASDRAWLGVSVGSVSSEAEALRIGLPEGTRGALVLEVFAGSPAEAAGIGQGDVIVEIAGDDIEAADDLIGSISEHDPGDEVTIVAVNTSGEHALTATLVERPSAPVDC